MTILYNVFFYRRDRKSLKNYDFLWEVMEENLSKTNKVPKPAWVFSSPPTLAELCFAAIRRHNVLERVLDPLKLVKRTSATNTDNDDQAENDDTISLLSFDDPISSDEAMNIDSDNTLGQHDFWAMMLGNNNKASVVGADLVATELNKLVLYNPPPWVEQPKKVFVRPGMEELFTCDSTCTCSFRYVPTLPTIPEFHVPTLLSLVSVWKNAASNYPSQNGCIDGSTTDPDMESSLEHDSSIEEHYFRLPQPLTSSVSDICSMETDEKVVHVIFDIDKLDRKNISGVKVDVNFNCQGQGEKRRRTNCCDLTPYKKLRREK